MHPNRKDITCDCGRKAVVEVVPDDLDDTPAGFTITITCSGACPRSYTPLTPEKMRELTGLPLSGWSTP